MVWGTVWGMAIMQVGEKAHSERLHQLAHRGAKLVPGPVGERPFSLSSGRPRLQTPDSHDSAGRVGARAPKSLGPSLRALGFDKAPPHTARNPNRHPIALGTPTGRQESSVTHDLNGKRESLVSSHSPEHGDDGITPGREGKRPGCFLSDLKEKGRIWAPGTCRENGNSKGVAPVSRDPPV
ncbi:hypothetical protein AAFF_G00138220 [Aldrovandia affinis]|uniref:Uncharacterized protein n=1 Tax=Aldrovandia affinis TaxID=143900 RepID=A0AAD7TD63_9TELE|nr:hypothetical protein AAFF_G00138220 [Aldrovandia affinis]